MRSPLARARRRCTVALNAGAWRTASGRTICFATRVSVRESRCTAAWHLIDSADTLSAPQALLSIAVPPSDDHRCPDLELDGFAQWKATVNGARQTSKCIDGYTGAPERMCGENGWEEIINGCTRMLDRGRTTACSTTNLILLAAYRGARALGSCVG